MMDTYYAQFKYLFLEQIEGIYFSDIVLLIIISALLSIVPGYILYIKNGMLIRNILLNFLTLVYLGVIMLLTIFRRKFGSTSGGIYTYFNLGINIHSIYSPRQFIYSLMNILLFIPWGILVGLRRTKQNLIKLLLLTTLTGFITSAIIEIIQHLTKTGNFEVTDLFTNVLGTFIGAILVIGATFAKRMIKNEFYENRQ